MRVGIPSYKRVDRLHTLQTLLSMGYDPDEIIISTQCENDFKAYSEAFKGNAKIIYAPATNDSENRNNCLDYFKSGEKLLLLDDDIKEFCRLTVSGDKQSLTTIKTKDEFERILKRQFDYANKCNSPLFAWYPTENAYFMSNSADIRNILVGTLFGVTNIPQVRFNPRFDLKGDFEISLRLMRQGYNAVRFNAYVCKADHKSKGGCEEARASGNNYARYRELLDTYPDLIKPSHRDGEIKYVGRRR